MALLMDADPRFPARPRAPVWGWILVALPLVGSGCALGINYKECEGATPDVGDQQCRTRYPDKGNLFCTSDNLCVVGKPKDRLCVDTVGKEPAGALIIAVLSDRSFDSDKAIENATRLAVDEINQRQAGASQPPIFAYLCDTASDPEQTLKAARFVVDEKKAVALIGPTTSGGLVNIAGFAKNASVLVMSPSATSTEISSLDDGGLIWRTAPSDALQAKLLAQKVSESTAALPEQPRLGVLFVDSVYGQGLARAVKAEYARVNGRGLIARDFTFKTREEIAGALNNLAKETPTHAVIIADVDSPAIVSMIRSQPGLNDTLFYLTDGAKTRDLYGPMGSTDPGLLRRIRGTAPAVPTGAPYGTFRQSFISKFSADPNLISFVANSYDAAYLVAIAAAATQGRPGGKEIANGLGRLRPMGATVPVGPTDYLMAVKQMIQGGVRLEGASGALDFDANGDPIASPGQFEVWCVDTTNAPTFARCTKLSIKPEAGPDMPAIKVNETVQLKATGGDTMPMDVTTQAMWASVDPAVAVVDNGASKGKVTGVKAGMTKIRATWNGLTAEIQLTVNP